MSIIQQIGKHWNDFKHETGQISEAEYLIKDLPREDQEFVKKEWIELNKTEIVSNPSLYYQKRNNFINFLASKKDYLSAINKQEIDKSFIIRGSADLFGYRPAGTRIWNYFANPFGVFSYIAQQHPAVRACVDLVRAAVEEDGYYLVAMEGVSKKKLQNVYDILKGLELDRIRTELIAHLEIYGNAWIHPVMKGIGGTLSELRLMYPNRLLPVFERTTEKIIEWEYLQGRIREIFKKKDLLQLMCPAADNDQIGAPPLVSAVTMIETAVHAMQLNNTIFQKGGLIGHIVALSSPDDGNVLNSPHDSDWVRRVQQQFDYLYSGAKAGQGVVAMANIEGVHKLTEIGELDANWQWGKVETDKTVAMLMGVPSEKIGIPRSQHAQYTPEMVEVVVNAQFDSTINRFCTKVDKFLNQKVLKDILGITDIKIVPSGRYGATTLSAAQTILILSQVGHLITVNEAREKILGWEPLPPDDPRGQIVLNNSAPRVLKGGKTADGGATGDTLLPDVLAPELHDPELYSNAKAIDKIWEDSGLCMKIGNGPFDGYIYKKNKERSSRRTY